MWWIIAGIVIVVAVIGFCVFARSPDRTGHDGEADGQGSSLADGPVHAPAEPGSEDRSVVADGVTGPGPGTEPLDQ